MSGKKVVKIGLNFSVKDEVNSLEWKIGCQELIVLYIS